MRPTLPKLRKTCAFCGIIYFRDRHRKGQRYCSQLCSAKSINMDRRKANAAQRRFTGKDGINREALSPPPTEQEVQQAVQDFLGRGGEIEHYAKQKVEKPSLVSEFNEAEDDHLEEVKFTEGIRKLIDRKLP